MNAATFIGEPLFFKNNIKVYPPKVKDVIANPHYQAYVTIFTTSQEDIWDMLAEKDGKEADGTPIKSALTPFEMMLNN